MSERGETNPVARDQAPGEQTETTEVGSSIAKYTAGLVAAAVLTGASFWVAGTSAVWAPGVPVLLAALAIAQMGVHLMFFLHITSGAEGTNNILALAFGIFVVGLVVFGSMIIMRDLDDNMTMPMDKMMQMQR